MSSRRNTVFPLRENVADALCAYADGVRYEELPHHVVAAARMLLFDYVAASHAGYRVNGEFNKAIDLVLASGAEGRSSVVLSTRKRPVLEAAMLNACYAHGADLDDGNKQAAGHAGVHVFSSVMALAEQRCSSNAAVIEAVVVGYDLYCRLSAACMPDMVERGFHSTGTAGTIAAAGACAKLLGLEAEGIYHAIALSASQASGLLLVGETGQEAKPLNAAKAAQSGIIAALLAENGVIGPRRPLESARGWLHAMTTSVDTDVLLDGLGTRFFIVECYMKPFPSCRHTHSAIEAALLLEREIGSSADVDSVMVRTYRHAIDLAGMPSPRSTAEAKFSIQYAVATALAQGRFGLDSLDVSSLSDEVARLMASIRLVEDDSYERPAEGIRGAQVAIRMRDGRELVKTVKAPKGEPENPFTWGDMEEKLLSCCVRQNGAAMNRAEVRRFVKDYGARLDEGSAPFLFPHIESMGA